MLEPGAAIEADAGDAHDDELDQQRIALLVARKIARRMVHGAQRAVGKGLGVKPRGLFGVLVVP